MLFEIFIVLLSSILILLYVMTRNRPKIMDLKGKHVVITGGSLGIGKELAIIAVKEGANVSLLARNKERLLAAKEELLGYRIDQAQKVECEAIDIAKSFEDTKKAFEKFVKANGPVDVLINNAGIFKSFPFSDLKPEEFVEHMRINYMGTVFCTKCVVDEMKKRRDGRIVFVSSQAGQIGIFGYTAYAPTKYALKGFSDCLQMELKPYNIYLTLAYPPDTDTPGLKEENLYKPLETQLILDESGVLKADFVASSIINALKKGEYNCSYAFNGFALTLLNSTTIPVASFSEAILQILTLPLCRIIMIILQFKFAKAIETIPKKKENE